MKERDLCHLCITGQRLAPEVPQAEHAVDAGCSQQVVLLPCKVNVPDGHGVRIGDGRALLHGPQVMQLHGAHDSVSLLRPRIGSFAESVIETALLVVLLCCIALVSFTCTLCPHYQTMTLAD